MSNFHSTIKSPRRRFSGAIAAGWLLLAATFPALPARAIYSYFYTSTGGYLSGSDIFIKEVRWPYWNESYYNVWINSVWTSTNPVGVGGYFYNGLALPAAGSPNPVGTPRVFNFSFWPLDNPINISDTINPVYTSPTTFAEPTTHEGTLLRSPGLWSLWQTNVWYRMVIRTWQPASGAAHQGYAGSWFRDPVAGVWYHMATAQLPFSVTGMEGCDAFQEDAGSSTQPQRTDYRNCYYHRDGVWNPATQFQVYDVAGASENVGLIEGNTAVYYEVCQNNSNYVGTLTATNPLSPILTLTQPATPPLDPILVTNYGATSIASQLLVQWQVPPTSSPQFAYQINVYTNASHTGTVVATAFDIAPEANQKLLAVPSGVAVYPQLTIIDLFNQTNPPISIGVTNAILNAATTAPGAVTGLNYAYYESATSYTSDSQTNWSSMPNFASLTPVLTGAVSSLDLTPRQRRIGYAFNYTGYLNVASNGLYLFTLNSCDGSKLYVDGKLVANGDGKHSPADATGYIGLQAGYHTLNVQYFFDTETSLFSDYFDDLTLSYEGPGIAKTVVPTSAFYRLPGGSEPSVTLVSPGNGSSISDVSVLLNATVTANGNILNKIQFYDGSYYWSQDTSAPYSMNSFFWAATNNPLVARVIYNGSNSIDSPVNLVTTTNVNLAPWQFGQIFYHNEPSGASVQAGTCSLIGDGVNLLTRQAGGDCTLIAHLSGLTSTAAAPDGSTAATYWLAGIILRGTTNMTPGFPWGITNTAPFTALFSRVDGGTYYQDETMVNGGGGYSSGNVGGQKWFKIQRVGNTFTSSVSTDGNNWITVWNDMLTDFGTNLYAGFFTYAGPSFNPNVHWASFDSINLTGTNIIGPASVNISPWTNTVVAGLPASFVTSIIGPAPTAYQWQFNGTNIPTATNANYNLPFVTSGQAGLYQVVVDGVTSAPAALFLSTPPGSGVWTNQQGGSWTGNTNWSGGLIANGTDAAAEFNILSLVADCHVTLDNAFTIGYLISDDLNPSTKHNWTISAGSGGPLTLATSSGTPTLAIPSANTAISAGVTGTQGFAKTGAGYLTLSGANTLTGTVAVNAGTLEVQSSAVDRPYLVAQGATLKIGYSTIGFYPNTALTINGDGASATTGLYLQGGASYNSAGTIVLQSAPTTIRQYGANLASIGIFDVNFLGLWCTADASGSVLDPNIQLVSLGFGMSVQADAGVNTATGDLAINGPLNVGSLGLFKRGNGSLLLKGPTTSGNAGLQIQGGTVICGAANCIGVHAAVPMSSGTSLLLNGFNQTVASLNAAAGSVINFGGTNVLATGVSPVLAGTLQMAISKVAAPASSKLIVASGVLTNGGALVINNLGPRALTAGDTFPLFNAAGYAGNFSSITLPALSGGLLWNTNNLLVNGTLSVAFDPATEVTTSSDTGPGSLRTIVGSAPAGSTILFAPYLSGQTIGLTNGELVLNKNLTIDASVLTNGIQINGRAGSRVFLVNSGDTAAIISLTISNGYAAADDGGGIYNGGTLTVSNCTITGNLAEDFGVGIDGGGGIYNNGTLTLDHCTLAGNLMMDHANNYDGGGGILNSGTLMANNSTFFGNASTDVGGGIDNWGLLTMVNCTVSGNWATNTGVHISGGGGILNEGGASLNLVNSIVAGNIATVGTNISGSLIGGGPATYSGSYNFTNGNALLNPPGYYGGPAQTMPPLPGSPVIDAGNDATAAGFATDQRGYARFSGLHVDLGAVEFQKVTNPFTLAGLVRLTNGAATFGFTNLAGATFTVFATTNVTLPLNAWTNIGSALETPLGSGQFQFSDPQATNSKLRFYRVRSQ